jgi:Glycosyl transferase family 2
LITGKIVLHLESLLSVFGTIKTLIPENWKRHVRELQLLPAFHHLYGPRLIQPSANEAVVTCLVKNGMFYIDHFIDHYFGMGFKHICFLDNGSTDKTLERAKSYNNVTVYRCLWPVETYQGLLKKHLAERAVRAGWCLDVDIDEFFEYPHSDLLPLTHFLEYLNARGYTAVITQMLDMFSERPLSSLARQEEENLTRAYEYYDISQVIKTNYLEDPLANLNGHRNVVPGAEASIYRGGIRKSVWGINCLLTKHSLFRTGVGLQLFPHVHFVNGARLADVSCALRHYKFASNAKDEAMQNKAAFVDISHHYSAIIDKIEKSPDLRITSDTAQKLRSASDLLENGFLFASEDYRSYARTRNGAGSLV